MEIENDYINPDPMANDLVIGEVKELHFNKAILKVYAKDDCVFKTPFLGILLKEDI